MNSAIFNTSTDSFQVSSIYYAGPVREIREENRRGDYTHGFKIITARGGSFCTFSDEEAARKARGALAGKIEAEKKHLFSHSGAVIDVEKIVSFSKTLALKNSFNDHTHAVLVTLEASGGNNSRVWLTYRSEENADKGRRALYAVLCACNRAESVNKDSENEATPELEEVAV